MPAIATAAGSEPAAQQFLAQSDLRWRLVPLLAPLAYARTLAATSIALRDELPALSFPHAIRLLKDRRIVDKLHGENLAQTISFRNRTRLIPSLPSHPLKGALFTDMMSELESRRASHAIDSGTRVGNGSAQLQFLDGIDCLNEVVAGWKAVQRRVPSAEVEPVLDLIRGYGVRSQAPGNEPRDQQANHAAMSNLVSSLSAEFALGKLDVGDDWRPVVELIKRHHASSNALRNATDIVEGVLDWQGQGAQFERFIVDEARPAVAQALQASRALIDTPALSNDLRAALLAGLTEALARPADGCFYFCPHAEPIHAGLEQHAYPMARTLIDTRTDLPPAIRGALKNLVSRVHTGAQWREDFSTLLPVMEHIPSAIRGEALASVAATLAGSDQVTYAHIAPIVTALIPHVSTMSPVDRGSALLEFVTALENDSATWEQLALVITTLRAGVDTMLDDERGGILSECAAALSNERTGFAQLQPLLAALGPHIATMPAHFRGEALSELSTALAVLHVDFVQLEPLLSALTPYADAMRSDDRGAVLWNLSDALLTGAGSFEQLAPTIHAMLPFLDTMPADELGGTLAELTGALANGRGTAAQLEPMTTSLLPYIHLMANDDRGAAFAAVSQVVAQAAEHFTQFGPLLTELTPWVGSMSDDNRGCALAALTEAVARGHIAAVESAPFVQALVPFVAAMPAADRASARISMRNIPGPLDGTLLAVQAQL